MWIIGVDLPIDSLADIVFLERSECPRLACRYTPAAAENATGDAAAAENATGDAAAAENATGDAAAAENAIGDAAAAENATGDAAAAENATGDAAGAGTGAGDRSETGTGNKGAAGGTAALPSIVFLPGYMSDMRGSKASAIFEQCRQNGQACLLLDYSGCGQSEGQFTDQTLIDWQSDVLAAIGAFIAGPVLLVGSSMGGWLMLLVARALAARSSSSERLTESPRLAGIIGIAAAPDFTHWGFSAAEKAIIAAKGQLIRETPYGGAPYVMTRALWESGEANRVLSAPIALSCPVRLLHGQGDADVPFQISLDLAAALMSADVRVTLIKSGDHRLSQDGDVALLLATVEEVSRASQTSQTT